MQNKGFEFKNVTDCGPDPYDLLFPTTAWGESRAPQLDSLTRPTRASPLVCFSAFLPFHRLSTLNLLPTDTFLCEWRTWMQFFCEHVHSMSLTTFTYSNSVFILETTPRSDAFFLISELLTKSSHYIVPIVRRQRYSNTRNLRISSALNSHISDPQNKTEPTAAAYTGPSIDAGIS